MTTFSYFSPSEVSQFDHFFQHRTTNRRRDCCSFDEVNTSVHILLSLLSIDHEVLLLVCLTEKRRCFAVVFKAYLSDYVLIYYLTRVDDASE